MRKTVIIDLEHVTLEGELVIPDDAHGLVIFSHGSGSSRFSPRNNFVAQQLQQRGIGTFLFDLLTEEEDSDYSQRFNIELLSQRLLEVTEQILDEPEIKNLPIGYFGASTGAASALIAAAELKNKISAVVSRGGRPDLAMKQLGYVKAPTLLIVGELDAIVIKLNKDALQKLHAIKHLEIVEGATHLFEEPGTLEQVAQLSGDWFIQYLSVKKLVH
jgi:putative phosphoribosyl transferase